MKRTICLFLTAVFLSVLCIPCAAADTGRAYPGFSDVAEGSASYEAIKYCYERGLMNGTSDTAFNPQGKLNIAQLVVLAARLYNLQNGGDGTVPELPDLTQPYLRFYDEGGRLIASYSTKDTVPEYNNHYICLSQEEDDPALPETCRIEIGLEGYNHLRSYTGTKQSFHSEPGAMSHGYKGTGYTFTDLDVWTIFWYNNHWYGEQAPLDLKSAWWFPAVFYLASEGKLEIEGELFYRTSGGNNDDAYNPLARFSSDNASRALFAWLVDLAAGDLETLNETVNVPDVTEETQDSQAILRLYRAGVLTGVDAEGNFGGSRELTRAQAAIMLARVLNPSARVKAA